MLVWGALCLLLLPVNCWTIFEPKKYEKGDRVELLLNKVESDHTQLPYRYHDLPFVCYDPAKRAKTLLLGQVLRGDRLWESNYNLQFGIDQPCTQLCDMRASQNGIARADSLIRNGYVAHWSLDGLPGATTFTSSNHGSKYYAAGFPLGFVKDDMSYLYNHVTLVIRHHREKNGKHAIVGFEVYPKSVNSAQCPGNSNRYKNLPLSLPKKDGKLVEQKTLIHYTYSVYWREDNTVTYNSRWDLYYDNDSSVSSGHIHWLSLINSCVLVCFVSLVVAVILLRTLITDLLNGGTLPLSQTEISNARSSGLWKSLVNVVMHLPHQVNYLSCLCALGTQSMVAMLGVIVIFVLNNTIPFAVNLSARTFFNNHQGAFFTCSVVLLLASGFVSSFAGINIHKLLCNVPPNTVYDDKKTRELSYAFSGILPATLFASVFFINLFVWAKESSNALPFGTIVALLLLFGLVELPLGILGGAMGNKVKISPKSFLSVSYIGSKPPQKYPRRKFSAARAILSRVAFGLIPFGIVYVDLLFIFNSVWLEKTTFFYMYGFLLATAVLLLVVVAESAVVVTYVSLAWYLDPNWQWLCFQVGSSLGYYVFAYSTYYFFTQLQFSDVVSVLIYFAYMALASAIIGISYGAVAVVAGFLFVRVIYSAARKD